MLHPPPRCWRATFASGSPACPPRRPNPLNHPASRRRFFSAPPDPPFMPIARPQAQSHGGRSRLCGSAQRGEATHPHSRAGCANRPAATRKSARFWPDHQAPPSVGARAARRHSFCAPPGPLPLRHAIRYRSAPSPSGSPAYPPRSPGTGWGQRHGVASSAPPDPPFRDSSSPQRHRLSPGSAGQRQRGEDSHRHSRTGRKQTGRTQNCKVMARPSAPRHPCGARAARRHPCYATPGPLPPRQAHPLSDAPHSRADRPPIHPGLPAPDGPSLAVIASLFPCRPIRFPPIRPPAPSVTARAVPSLRDSASGAKRPPSPQPHRTRTDRQRANPQGHGQTISPRRRPFGCRAARPPYFPCAMPGPLGCSIHRPPLSARPPTPGHPDSNGPLRHHGPRFFSPARSASPPRFARGMPHHG